MASDNFLVWPAVSKRLDSTALDLSPSRAVLHIKAFPPTILVLGRVESIFPRQSQSSQVSGQIFLDLPLPLFLPEPSSSLVWLHTKSNYRYSSFHNFGCLFGVNRGPVSVHCLGFGLFDMCSSRIRSACR